MRVQHYQCTTSMTKSQKSKSNFNPSLKKSNVLAGVSIIQLVNSNFPRPFPSKEKVLGCHKTVFAINPAALRMAHHHICNAILTISYVGDGPVFRQKDLN